MLLVVEMTLCDGQALSRLDVSFTGQPLIYYMY